MNELFGKKELSYMKEIKRISENENYRQLISAV